MNRFFSKLAALLFAVFAAVHLARIAKGWEVTLDGTGIPMWISYVAIAASSLLSLGLWREGKGKSKE